MSLEQQLWNNTILNYADKHCKQNGDPIRQNLTKSQSLGSTKLRKRADSGELVISETDKSNRTSISSRENYRLQGAPHVKNDLPVDWDFIKTKRREIQAHTRALINVFSVGKDQGEQQELRLRNACMEQSTLIPKARVQQKDHKPVNQDGIPKARFLCNAANTMNQIASDILTDCLQGMHKSDQTHECNSTEDFIS